VFRRDHVVIVSAIDQRILDRLQDFPGIQASFEDDFPSRLRARRGGHRREATRSSLSVGAVRRLGQGQEPARSSTEPPALMERGEIREFRNPLRSMRGTESDAQHLSEQGRGGF
jgi:hypothetical protein